MSDKERENFLHGAISRAPGKRQIKPTNLATEDFVLQDSDETDEEFVGNEDESGSEQEESGEDEEESSDNEEEQSETGSRSNDVDNLIDVKPSTASGKPEPLICSICLNMRNVPDDRVIQCDKGITFGDLENLSAISWQEIDYKRFGRKPCDGCTHILEARTGIVTSCEAGLCKHNYHISCAQRLGLLIDAESENLPELSSKHVDPHFILCRTHNIPELVAKKRQNYAIFINQEQRRFVSLNRRMLDQRELFKLERQRKQYDSRIKDCKNVTIHMPAIHNKRPRLLQSSSDFLEAFTEKAELFGVSLQEFTDGFTRLPPAQLNYLPPSFSTEFVKYFEHRENTVFAEEEKRLRDDECELKKVEQAEKDLKLLIEKMSTKSTDNAKAAKQRSSMEQKFMALCEKLNITIEREEELSDKEEDSSSKTKRLKVEVPSPTTKRLSNDSEADHKNHRASRSNNTIVPSPNTSAHKTSSTQKPKSQHTNFRLLKKDSSRKRRSDRGASVDSVDSNLETEGSTPSPINMPSSESSPPCLKNVDDESVTSEQSLSCPILLPMITLKESLSTRLTSNKSTRLKKRRTT